MKELAQIHPIPGRKTPAQGAKITLSGPSIFFLTVNTKARMPWMAQPGAHEDLQQVWRKADTWLVGDYLLMPDHVHLFCSPRDLAFTLEDWLSYWKSQFSRQHLNQSWRWQRAGFHHRIRDGKEFTEKWNYVQQNPVRKGLVKEAKDWPYRGRIFEIGWR